MARKMKSKLAVRNVLYIMKRKFNTGIAAIALAVQIGEFFGVKFENVENLP